MDLSVVIPCHGGAGRLPETLAALRQATPPAGGFEIVVSDDGSEPPLAPPPGWPPVPELRCVRQAPARGRAAACNRGIEAARGRVVLILDDDMSLAPDALSGHVAAHAAGERLAVIGRIEPDPAHFRGPFGRFLAEEERRRHERLAAQAERVAFTDCLTGHFSAPRALLLEAGGYDETFTRYGLEDIELAFRLERAGARLVYRAALVARHRSEHGGFRRHCRRHLDVGAMAALFARRHDDPRIAAFLRADGMDPRAERSPFRRAMARAHTLARATPPPLRPALLLAARALAGTLALTGPVRLRHAAYHIVRDMHYAAGIAAAKRAPR